MEIYEKTVEVLEPEVTKLMKFMYFQVNLSPKQSKFSCKKMGCPFILSNIFAAEGNRTLLQ